MMDLSSSSVRLHSSHLSADGGLFHLLAQFGEHGEAVPAPSPRELMCVAAKVLPVIRLEGFLELVDALRKLLDEVGHHIGE